MGDDIIGGEGSVDAARYYSLATANGNGKALVKYAYCMILGLGIPKDVSGGFELLRVISQQSNASIYFLANSIAKESVEDGTMSVMINLPFLDVGVEGKFVTRTAVIISLIWKSISQVKEIERCTASCCACTRRLRIAGFQFVMVQVSGQYRRIRPNSAAALPSNAVSPISTSRTNFMRRSFHAAAGIRSTASQSKRS